MHRRTGTYFMLILLCVLMQLPVSLIAQNEHYKKFSFTKEKKKKILIPFKSVHNLVIIPLRINNSDTLNFILDSGAKHTVITELPEGDSLSLNYTQELEVAGLGDGKPIPALHSRGNFIYLEGIEGVNQEILVLLEDKFFLSTSLGMEINGIIGYDLFKDFVVKVNYLRNYVILYDPTHFKKKRREKVIPFKLERFKPYITAEIGQTDSSRREVILLLDMGASHGCSLYPFADSNLIKPDKTVRAFLGKGLTGDINGEVGRIGHIKIGEYILKEPVVAYPDEENAKMATDIVDHQGAIGSEILRRFHITFDYRNSQIYLRPNRNFSHAFNFNLTGMNIVAPHPGLPLYMIDRVLNNSPAERAGIQEGDIIEKINGKIISSYSLTEVMDFFNAHAGTKVFVAVRRNNKLLYLKLELEDQI